MHPNQITLKQIYSAFAWHDVEVAVTWCAPHAE